MKDVVISLEKVGGWVLMLFPSVASNFSDLSDNQPNFLSTSESKKKCNNSNHQIELLRNTSSILVHLPCHYCLSSNCIMLHSAYAGTSSRPYIAAFVKLARHRAHRLPRQTGWRTYATEAILQEEESNTSNTLASMLRQI